MVIENGYFQDRFLIKPEKLKKLLKTLLKKEGTLSDKLDKDLGEEESDLIEEAVRYAQEGPLPSPEEALEDLFINP